MSRHWYLVSFVFLGFAGLVGCASQPPKKEAAAPDKIQGKAQIVTTETSALDASMNAGGPSVYLLNGLSRYRLFFNKPFQVDPGKEYVAEGVQAQKAIDAIGDPDQGKNGYPLESKLRPDREDGLARAGAGFDGFLCHQPTRQGEALSRKTGIPGH